jgi:hypothetical protein
MNKKDIKLYDLVDYQDPEAVLNEIIQIISLLEADIITDRFRLVYEDIKKLFNGRYPGYRASNTKYHNLEHTIMVTLATARLTHGCARGGIGFIPENILLGLLASLFHDAGLIQTEYDRKGTGAKYTIGHEHRSAEFMRRNLTSKKFSKKQMDACEHLIRCTNLDIDIADIPFQSDELAIMGKIVASSDLLGQMADRHYLEKLILLFKEFEEAGIPGFASEGELIEKTEGFYKNVAKKRLTKDLDNIAAYMKLHFRHRWNISRDLYAESIKNNISFLKSVLSHGKKTKNFYRQYLKRGGIVTKLMD